MEKDPADNRVFFYIRFRGMTRQCAQVLALSIGLSFMTTR